MSIEKTLILASFPLEDVHFAAIVNAIASVAEAGLGLFQYGSTDEQPDRIVNYWIGSRPSETIVLTEDYTLHIAYLSITAVDRERVDAISLSIARKVKTATLDVLRDAAVEEPGEERSWIGLGLGAGAYDIEIERIIIDALKDERAIVRGGAVKAAALAKWPQLVPALTEARGRQENERLSELFKYAISRCKQGY